MKGLIKATNAASTEQSRSDYARLQSLAREYGFQIAILPSDWGWRRIDRMAEIEANHMLLSRPELKSKLAEIYPGFFPNS